MVYSPGATPVEYAASSTMLVRNVGRVIYVIKSSFVLREWPVQFGLFIILVSFH